MAVAPCGLWLLQEYVWGKDSVWTEMVRGQDICRSKLHDGNGVLHLAKWEEVDYSTGANKHNAVISPRVRISHVTVTPKYMYYRSRDWIGNSCACGVSFYLFMCCGAKIQIAGFHMRCMPDTTGILAFEAMRVATQLCTSPEQWYTGNHRAGRAVDITGKPVRVWDGNFEGMVRCAPNPCVVPYAWCLVSLSALD